MDQLVFSKHNVQSDKLVLNIITWVEIS